jgi:exonuclease III
MKQKAKPQSGTKITIGSGKRKKQSNSLFVRHSRIFFVAAAVLVGGVGTYFIIRSFAATPEIYSATSAPITIASWNTFVDNKTKMSAAVPTLLQTADIVGLQEVHMTAQRNSVKNNLICATCAYDGVMYKNKNTKKKIDPRGGYPLIWKRDLFQRVDTLHVEKVASEVTVTKKIRFKARYAEWTILKDKRTGNRFIILNTHTYAKAEYQGKSRGYKKIDQGYKSQMAKTSKLIKSLQSKNLPIFVIGDLNVDYRYDNGTVAYFPKATFNPLGLVSNWSSANYPENDSTTGTAPSEDSIASISDEDTSDTVQSGILGTLRVGAGGRIIDYVYAWNRNDVAFQSTSISNDTYGSDHAPIFATYVISNLSSTVSP